MSANQSMVGLHPVAAETDTPDTSGAPQGADEPQPALGGSQSDTGHREHHRTHEWASRRFSALAVRGVALVGPMVAAAVVVAVVAHRVGRPTGWIVVPWWIAMSLLGAVLYSTFERVGRRILPLSVLLQLSLVFPDEMPSRYRIALRSGTSRQLKAAIAAASDEVAAETPAEAAERVLVLCAALNSHDRLTRGHSERVRGYAEVLGCQMGMDETSLAKLRWAALLHDVGKVAVPSEVLNKPGRLTDEEFEMIKVHPAEGARLVEPLRDWLGDAVDAVGQHHERIDGGGYPAGLRGEEITLEARIVSVADTFDVITSVRSYKTAMSPAAARREIERCTGTQFDPVVTRALMEVSIGRLCRSGGLYTSALSASLLAKVPSMSALLPASGTLAGAAVAGAAVVTLLGGISVAGDLPGSAGTEVAAVGSSPDGRAGTASAPWADATASDGGPHAGAPDRAATGADSSDAERSADSGADGSADGSDGEDADGADEDGSAGRSDRDPDAAMPNGPAGPGDPTGPSSPGGVGVAVPNTPEVSVDLSGAPIVGGLVPALQLPSVPVPAPLPIPGVDLPPVSVPPITLPPITVPPITVPPVTVPAVLGGLLGG